MLLFRSRLRHGGTAISRPLEQYVIAPASATFRSFSIDGGVWTRNRPLHVEGADFRLKPSARGRTPAYERQSRACRSGIEYKETAPGERVALGLA